MQFVLDNVFDNELGADGRMLMSLARAAHTFGQVIVISQSEAVAKEVAVSTTAGDCEQVPME